MILKPVSFFFFCFYCGSNSLPYVCFVFFFYVEAAVRARQLALQFGRRVPSLCQFLRGEAYVHQHSCRAVGAQSGCRRRCETFQPFISLSREVSQHFLPRNICFLTVDCFNKQTVCSNSSLPQVKTRRHPHSQFE